MLFVSRSFFYFFLKNPYTKARIPNKNIPPSIGTKPGGGGFGGGGVV